VDNGDDAVKKDKKENKNTVFHDWAGTRVKMKGQKGYQNWEN